MIVLFGGNIYVITGTIIGADVMFTDCVDDNSRFAGRSDPAEREPAEPVLSEVEGRNPKRSRAHR
jgi:hypothetical protein